MRTLGKIADASDGAVTVDELALAAGVKQSPASPVTMTHEEIVEAFNKGLLDMANLAKGALSCSTDVTSILKPYMKVLADLPVRGCHASVEDAKPYTGTLCSNCELYSVASVSARDEEGTFCTYMVLYLIQTAEHGYFMVDIAFDGAALHEVNGLPHEIEVEIDAGDMTLKEVDENKQITVFTPHSSQSSSYSNAKKSLFRALIGLQEPDGVHKKYPITCQGIGFFTDDIDTDMLHTFFEEHDETVSQIAAESVENDYALLAAVLSKETPYSWDYFQPEENDRYAYNRSCVMIDSDSFPRYTDELIDSVAKVACALGVERFGAIMFTYDIYNYASFRQYEISDGEVKQIEDFARDNLWALFPEQPAKPGIYKVRDKLGRIWGAIFNDDGWTDFAGGSLYRPIAWLCSGVFEKEV